MAKIENHRVTIGIASSQILGPNPRRKMLVLSSPRTNRVSYFFGEEAVLDGGITLSADRVPLVLTHDECGEALHEAIFAIAAVAPETVGIMEVNNP